MAPLARNLVETATREPLGNVVEATLFLETEDRHFEQGSNAADHRSHSRSEKPRTGVISGAQMQLGTQPLTFWTGDVSGVERQRGMAATHSPESQ